MAGHVATEFGSTASTMVASQMFYLLLVPLFILWLVYFKLSRRNLNRHAANIPGPPGYPVIGNLFDLMGSSHSKCCALLDQFFVLFHYPKKKSIVTLFSRMKGRIAGKFLSWLTLSMSFFDKQLL